MVAAAGLLIIILCKDRSQLLIHLRDVWMFLGTGIASIAFFNILPFSVHHPEHSFHRMHSALVPGPCVGQHSVSGHFFRLRNLLQKKGRRAGLAGRGCAQSQGQEPCAAGGVSISWQALLSGLGAGLGYGLYSIFGRVALKKYSELTVTFYTFLVTSLSLLPFCHIGEIVATLLAGLAKCAHSPVAADLHPVAVSAVHHGAVSHGDRQSRRPHLRRAGHGDYHQHYRIRRDLHHQPRHRHDRHRDVHRAAEYHFQASPEVLANILKPFW